MEDPAVRTSMEKLDKKIECEQFYDAHQLSRAIFDRFNKKKDHEGALAFSEKYGIIFAENGQFELTVNLGMRSLEVIKAAGIAPTAELQGRLALFFDMCPAKSTDTKYEFMDALIRWSKDRADFSGGNKQSKESQQQGVEQGEAGSGSVELHEKIAEAYLEDGKFGIAQKHAVYCDKPELFAALIHKWQEAGYPSEKHFFTLRLVCILLSRRAVATARTFLDKLVSECTPETPAPLQAAHFLVVSAQSSCFELFEMVQRRYALIFRVDPAFSRLFPVIEAKVFDVKREQTGLMHMLKSMLGGPKPPMALSSH